MKLFSKCSILLIILLQSSVLFGQELENISANRFFVKSYQIFKTAIKNKNSGLKSTYENQLEFRECFKLLDDIVEKFPSSNIATDIIQGKVMFESTSINELKSKTLMPIHVLFHKLCEELDSENIKVILNKYYPSQIDKYSVLSGLVATKFNDDIIFDLLISKVEKVNYNSLIIQAAGAGSLYAFSYLLKNNTEELPTYLLHSACEGGNREIVNILIQRGLDVKRVDRSGFQPIHLSINNKEICKLLFDSGANVNAVILNNKKKLGYTPLHLATELGNHVTCKMLLSLGADANVIIESEKLEYDHKFRDKITLLEYLIEERRFRLNSDFYKEERENYEKTAFVILISNKYLLINKLNKNGLTPLNMVIQYGDLELAQYIQHFKGDINIASNQINYNFGLSKHNEPQFYKDNLDFAVNNLSLSTIDFLFKNGFNFVKLSSGRTLADHILRLTKWKNKLDPLSENDQVEKADLVIDKLTKIKTSISANLREAIRTKLFNKFKLIMSDQTELKIVQEIAGTPITVKDLKNYPNETLNQLLKDYEDNLEFRNKLKNSAFKCEFTQIKQDLIESSDSVINEYSNTILTKIRDRFIALAEENFSYTEVFRNSVCVLSFRVDSNGGISEINYGESKRSGLFGKKFQDLYLPPFDEAAKNSVLKSAPFSTWPNKLKSKIPQNKSTVFKRRSKQYINYTIKFFVDK